MSRKKLKLEKRSRQSARIHKGLEMPVGMGSEDSILGFRNSKELSGTHWPPTFHYADIAAHRGAVYVYIHSL